MRYLLTFLLLSLAQIACSQKYPDELVRYRVSVNYTDHSITFFVHPLKAELIPNPQKRYYWYSNNDVRSTQGGYSGKLLNGPYIDFYKNRQLKEQGYFIRGLKIGKWQSWTEGGTLKEESWWKNGLGSGLFLRYDSLGNLMEKGQFRQGKLHGKNIIFTQADSAKVTYYKRGEEYIPKPLIPVSISKIIKKRTGKTEGSAIK